MEKNNMIFSGKPYLTAALMLLILVISTACQSKTKQSIVSVTAEIAPFKPVIVADDGWQGNNRYGTRTFSGNISNWQI